jgi:hypothetical protein
LDVPAQAAAGSSEFDYFVIGGGSGGVRSARIAARHGARVGIAEAKRWGGTCVNVGCVPKKLLTMAARYAADLAEAPVYGWDQPVISHDWQASVLTHSGMQIIGLTSLLLVVKIICNMAASLMFGWFAAGALHLGFMLAQGSEFAFVILSLPPVRQLLGESQASITVAVVALSLAITPNVSRTGGLLASRMRLRRKVVVDDELVPQIVTSPVLVVGMGTVGRTVVDALIAFDVGYHAVERDERRLRAAIADGYEVSFGDGTDLRLWQSVDLHGRKISVITAPDFADLQHTTGPARRDYPHLKRLALAKNGDEANRLRSIGLKPIVDKGDVRGIALAVAVLSELGYTGSEIRFWVRERRRSKPQLVPVRVFG